MRSHVKEATLLSNVGAEVSFQLPNDASSSFQDMLTEIDSRKAELGIDRCAFVVHPALSIKTRKSVFCRDRPAYYSSFTWLLRPLVGSVSSWATAVLIGYIDGVVHEPK